MIYKLIFVILGLICTLNAVEYISEKDQQRLTKYKCSNRHETEEIKGLTKDINNKLTDHKQIDYSRTASIKEKEIIFKAIIGSLFIHEYDFCKLQKPSTLYPDKRFLDHYSALKVVEEVVEDLFIHSKGDRDLDCKAIKVILERLYTHKKIDYNSLLTPYFLDWFYEAASSYRPTFLPAGKAKILPKNNKPHQGNLNLCKNSASQNTDFYYEKSKDGFFMVAEKLTIKNLSTWDEFEQKQKPKREEIKNEIDPVFFRNLGGGFLAFKHTLKMFKDLTEKEKSLLDVWIMYVYAPQNSTETPSPFDISNIDNVEMSVTALTSPGCNMSVHMGIERNTFHIAKKLPRHPNLAVTLHRFTAKTTKAINPLVQYFTTKPTCMMMDILKTQLLQGSYYLGENLFEDILTGTPEAFKNLSHPELSQGLERITVNIDSL